MFNFDELIGLKTFLLMALIYLFIKRHDIYWNNAYLFQLAWLSKTYNENASTVDYVNPVGHWRLLAAAVGYLDMIIH